MKACRVPLTIVLLALPVVAAAQRGTQIRLATIAPDNSVWVDALKQMGSEWQRATNGRVSLNVFPGGAAGDEPTVLRKLRLGNPNAAALTQPGLSEIDEAFNVFGIPFFFTSDEELVYVLEKLEPTLKDVLQQKGLALVHWGHGGWAHLFSAQQVRSIDDLKRAKIFTSAGDDKSVQWYKRNGFEPVPLALTDVLLGLNTGLINTYPSPPYASLLLQWYTKTPFMLSVPLGPVIGATVIAERTWKSLSDADREEMLEIAKDREEQLMADVPRQDRDAVGEMQKRGLTVTTLDAAAEAEFRKTAGELTASMRGFMVPERIFDMAVAARAEFRAK